MASKQMNICYARWSWGLWTRMKEIKNKEFYKITILYRVVREGIPEQRSNGNKRMGQAVIWGRAF